MATSRFRFEEKEKPEKKTKQKRDDSGTLLEKKTAVSRRTHQSKLETVRKCRNNRKNVAINQSISMKLSKTR